MVLETVGLPTEAPATARTRDPTELLGASGPDCATAAPRRVCAEWGLTIQPGNRVSCAEQTDGFAGGWRSKR
jgi:hypothetical protein